MNIKESIKISKWLLLKEELIQRTISPFKHPEFVFYFIIIIIIAGSAGVWCQYILPNVELKKLEFSLSIYFIVLSSTGLTQIILINDSKIDNVYKIFGICFFIIVGLLALLSIYISFIFAIIGIILSLYIWWIGNAENPELTSEPSYDKVLSNKTNEKIDALGDLP